MKDDLVSKSDEVLHLNLELDAQSSRAAVSVRELQEENASLKVRRGDPQTAGFMVVSVLQPPGRPWIMGCRREAGDGPLPFQEAPAFRSEVGSWGSSGKCSRGQNPEPPWRVMGDGGLCPPAPSSASC